jgi:hypothetical protein
MYCEILYGLYLIQTKNSKGSEFITFFFNCIVSVIRVQIRIPLEYLYFQYMRCRVLCISLILIII